MTRSAGDALKHTVRDLRHQCSRPATAADVLDVMRHHGMCSVAAVCQHLETSRHGWVVWDDVAAALDDLVDSGELVMRLIDGPRGRYTAYSLLSDHEGG